MTAKIKLFEPSTNIREEQVIKKILKSGFWASGSGIGKVEEFEKSFKNYIKCNDCIAVNSGSAALNLALSLFDIKNKEVILPSLSFVSTAHAVIVNGGIPVFVDIEPENLCIDISKLGNLISKKTKIILPVHFGGMPCNLKEIMKLGKKHGLNVIEDAAHATGAIYNRKKIGSHGTAVCFSFHPVKNLAMPTGGLISINNRNFKEFREQLSSRRWCGITNRKGVDYDVEEMGWNYYMNEFSAAIGLEQLKKIDRLNNIRKKIAREYYNKINIEKKMQFNENCSYHLYWILVKNRQKFRKKLDENGIETGTHYKPIHLMKMYKKNISLPITEAVGKQIVTIPIHPNLKKSEIQKIIKCVNDSA